MPPRASTSKMQVAGRISVQQRSVSAAEKDAKPMAFTSTPSLIDTAMPIAPERYGKYHLLERIGIGGMAEVWRAKTLGSEGFTKDLVIKRILPKITNDEESVRMFIDEARLVAKLHHPNIVQIFDFDKEGDRYYLAMELIEGRDLRQGEKAAAKSGVWFPVPLSVYLVSEALKGLHYAHTRQDHGKALEIVHRDVSPHNILISYSGDVKISDFGIAKVAERASSTTSGTVKGKLAYMSPEQITGQPLDGRTDIYSMGIVFWELLTRHRLFFGPDEHDVIRRVRDGIVPPPRQYNPDIPEEVEKIVMKMLVANRAQRYQSAGEVARLLCALPQYDYEAQSLGEFMRTLFPEQTRNWTQMLQNMLNAPAPAKPTPTPGESASVQVILTPPEGAEPPTPPTPPAGSSAKDKPPALPAPPPLPASTPALEPPAPRSTMASSEQKTQIATELPPQVANVLSGQAGGAPVTPTSPASGARTVIATAPSLPTSPPPGGLPESVTGARTVMAAAPALPNVSQSPLHATVLTGPGAPAPAPSTIARGAGAPMQLKPASAVFSMTTPTAGMPPTMKWIIGPGIALFVALLTTYIANHVWPPSTNSGGTGGPSILAAKRVVQIVTDPPGAEVQVDGVVASDKTPTEIKGDIGKSAHVRVLLAGYDPYEATLVFTKDPRPPLRVRLSKVGSKAKNADNSAYDERPNIAPKEDDDDDNKKPTADKGDKAAPDKGDKGDKATPDKGDKGDKAAADKGDKATPDKGDKGEGEDEEPGKKHKKHEKAEAGDAKKAKATLTVLVRPWAIVYVDGKKIQQTPLRNYPISAGSHKILLKNENKGKNEEIKLKVSPGDAIPEIKRNWD